MKHTAFDTYHPLIPALYLLATLTFTMSAFHPVYVAMSFAVAVAYNTFLRGWRAALRTATWQLPLLAIIAVLNPVFSSSGSTLLFRIGHQGIYLESFLYGLFMGLSLLAVMQWFSNLSHVLTSDKIMQLTGNVAPTLGLMIAMILRLVPQFMQRNSAVSEAQRACTSASVGGGSARTDGEAPAKPRLGFLRRRAFGIRRYLRDVSVLMAWGMEDSLDTAEAMRARGWGAAPKRSTYQRNSFKFRDGILLGLMICLIAISAACAIAECSRFTFYPTLSPIGPWWGYAPCLITLAIPFALEAKEHLAWRFPPQRLRKGPRKPNIPHQVPPCR